MNLKDKLKLKRLDAQAEVKAMWDAATFEQRSYMLGVGAVTAAYIVFLFLCFALALYFRARHG